MRFFKTTTLLTVTLMMASAQTLHATPIYDTFGPLPEATWGGSGIPNNAVAIGTATFDGTTITAALQASQRYGNPAVTSNGAGTYFATPGSNFGDANQSTDEGALWNFNYFIEVDGGGRTIEDLQFDIYYDFDPAAGTVITDLGEIDVTAGVVLGGTPISLVQGSENLLFNYLENPSPPFDALIAPPSGSVTSFDPNAVGEYTFAIVASDPGTGFAVEIVAIDVQVVPEPTSLALLGLGGLGLMRRRRTNC